MKKKNDNPALEFRRVQEKRITLEIWYSGVLLSTMTIFGEILALGLDHHILGRPLFESRLPPICAALACLLILVCQNKNSSYRTTQTLLIFLIFILLIGMWYHQSLYVTSNAPSTPLYAFQTLALLVAGFRYGKTLIPNIVLLLIISVEIVTFWFYYQLEQNRYLHASGYAAVFLLTGVAAIFILITRHRYEHTFRSLIELEIRHAEIKRSGRLLLSIRDKGNSPLQTLEIGLNLLNRALDKGTLPERNLIEAQVRAFQKLKALHEGFAANETCANWYGT